MTLEADIIHDIPANLAEIIGRVIVAYARIEHNLTSLAGLLLQLNKPEMRVALRTPRAVDRLDMALDLFAIKALVPTIDETDLRGTIEKACTERDMVAHGLWLRHPETGELFLRLTRGSWPKDIAPGDGIKRAIFPQSIPYPLARCTAALQLCERALRGSDQLGHALDNGLKSSPDRFRPPSPVMNPLGYRKPKESRAQPKPSRGKRST